MSSRGWREGHNVTVPKDRRAYRGSSPKFAIPVRVVAKTAYFRERLMFCLHPIFVDSLLFLLDDLLLRMGEPFYTSTTKGMKRGVM